MKRKVDFKDKITIDDLNENQYRVRRNLLIFSTIGVFYKIYSDKYEIKIKQIFGIIEFESPLNPDILEKGLMYMILYFFIHWTLIFWQHLKFMRIRVTQNDGGRSEPGEWGDENFEKDYPKNPTESNLYYWFNKHFEQLNLDSKEIAKYKNELLEALQEIQKRYLKENSSVSYQVSIDEILYIKKDIKNIKLILEKIENEDSRIHNQERLKKSIKNFDNWFNCYNKIELVRFIIIIHLFPLILGLLSILLFIKFY